MLSTETRRQIERRALEISAVLDAKAGPYNFEIYPDVSPAWHVLNVFANTEDRTAEHLIDRGAGIFVPRFQNGAKMRIPIPYEKRSSFDRAAFEEIDLSNKLIFPGRIFLFVWDVLEHWRRIKSCPGVQAIMVDDRERPVIVPDHEIGTIQMMQFSLMPQPKAKRDRYKGRNRGLNQDEGDKDRMTLTTKSYWAAEGATRNSLLDKALGIYQPS